ncbi:hypothetical protein ABOM_002470 [Aspergillus bombycis]|uniref:Zn(2)-C6 fungal-type domain-containing protein n=1 Tax=Aspergillus bombycis TaxID=109264 RepID=A0A1F8AAB4_9EURO|nr:hypothetical protein ABOM_002470 [Aspergillus bombycis]OGM48591.1 hypothetical protein ABOM_002470 [Aspergillus bombycis]
MVSSSDVPSHLSTSWKAAEAPSRRSSPRLCSACDACRQSRVKCTGGNPCQRCGNNGANCHYSVSLRNGRLKANRVQKPVAQASPPYSGSPTGRHNRGNSRDLHLNDSLSANTDTISAPQSVSNDGLSSCDKSPSFTGPYFATGLNHSSLLQVSADLNVRHPFSTPMDSITSNLVLSRDMLLGIGLGSGSSTDDEWSSSTGVSCFNMPPSPLDLGGRPRSARCACMRAQLLCIAELSGAQEDIDYMVLGSILELSRQTCEQIRQELSCTLCTKDSTRFIMTMVALQHLTNLFCRVAKNGAWYVSNARLGLGSFRLSEEEDRAHKSLLVVSSLGYVDAILDLLGSSVREFHYAEIVQQKTGETATETGRSNLKWTMEMISRLRSQVQTMIKVIGGLDWGRTTSGIQQGYRGFLLSSCPTSGLIESPYDPWLVKLLPIDFLPKWSYLGATHHIS